MVEAETVVTGTSLKISVPREELTRQLGVVARCLHADDGAGARRPAAARR